MCQSHAQYSHHALGEPSKVQACGQDLGPLTLFSSQPTPEARRPGSAICLPYYSLSPRSEKKSTFNGHRVPLINRLAHRVYHFGHDSISGDSVSLSLLSSHKIGPGHHPFLRGREADKSRVVFPPNTSQLPFHR